MRECDVMRIGKRLEGWTEDGRQKKASWAGTEMVSRQKQRMHPQILADDVKACRCDWETGQLILSRLRISEAGRTPWTLKCRADALVVSACCDARCWRNEPVDEIEACDVWPPPPGPLAAELEMDEGPTI